VGKTLARRSPCLITSKSGLSPHGGKTLSVPSRNENTWSGQSPHGGKFLTTRPSSLWGDPRTKRGSMRDNASKSCSRLRIGLSPLGVGKITTLPVCLWPIPTSVRKLQQAAPGLPPVFGQSPHGWGKQSTLAPSVRSIPTRVENEEP